jgi:DNA-binding IclR family transcriptional regulator
MVDIARALHYPESSTSVLLRSLVTMGYIDYDRSNRTYHPTRRVRLLGNWIDEPLFRNGRILHLMDDLSAETSDTIILASRNGLNVQYIHVVQAQTALRLHLPPGTIRPLTTSATGWVLLSALPDLEIAKLVRRLNALAPSLDHVVKISDLLRLIGSIRADGHVVTRSSVTPGATILAMPLPSGLTNSPLAIAIGSPSNRMEPRTQELIALLSRRIRESFTA